MKRDTLLAMSGPAAGRPRRAPAAADRRRDPERTRAALLDAALQEFAAKGRAGARVSEIAARAGVDKQLISYYFGGKDGLLEALVVEGFTGLRSAVVAARGTDARARLHAACTAYRTFAVAHPQHYRLLFEQMPRLVLGGEAQRAADGAFDELVARVDDAVRAGHLAAAPPALVAQQLWAAAHGAVSLEIAGLARADAPAAYAGMVQALLDGLARRDGSTQRSRPAAP